MKPIINAQEVAEELKAATTAGDLAAAYLCINGIALKDLEKVALMFGLSVTSYRKPHDGFQAIQSSVALACRKQVDGFGLQKLQGRTRLEKNENNKL